MGLIAWIKRLFASSKETPEPSPEPKTKKPPAPIVRVAYIDGDDPQQDEITTERGGGYAYYWRAPGEPQLGQRVLAPVMSGSWAEAVIVGFWRDGYKGRIKSITQLAR